MDAKVTIYIDGACRGNPGPGGWAAILLWRGRTRELTGGEFQTTNNRMELTAAIRALEALKRPAAVEIHSDSQYLVKGITEWLPAWRARGWRTARKQPVENLDLWMRLTDLVEGKDIVWHWLRGHSGNPLNERADRLAVAAIPSPVSAKDNHMTKLDED